MPKCKLICLYLKNFKELKKKTGETRENLLNEILVEIYYGSFKIKKHERGVYKREFARGLHYIKASPFAFHYFCSSFTKLISSRLFPISVMVLVYRYLSFILKHSSRVARIWCTSCACPGSITRVSPKREISRSINFS